MADDNGGANLAWFLLGAALGAVGALLLAPQAGGETRQLVRRKAEESRDVLEKSGRQVYDRGRELYEKGKELADEASKKFKREGKKEGEPAAPSV